MGVKKGNKEKLEEMALDEERTAQNRIHHYATHDVTNIDLLKDISISLLQLRMLIPLVASCFLKDTPWRDGY